MSYINEYERSEMISLGLNPMLPEHREYYSKGGRTLTKEMMQENLKRIGMNALKKPSKDFRFEKEIDVNNLIGKTLDEVPTTSPKSTRMNKDELLKESMDSYFNASNNTINRNRFNSAENSSVSMDSVTEKKAEDLFRSLNNLFRKNNNFNDWLNYFSLLKDVLTDIKNSDNQNKKLQTLEYIKKEFINSI